MIQLPATDPRANSAVTPQSVSSATATDRMGIAWPRITGLKLGPNAPEPNTRYRHLRHPLDHIGSDGGERQREHRGLLRRAVSVRPVGRLPVRGMLGSPRGRRGLAAVLERLLGLDAVRLDVDPVRVLGLGAVPLRALVQPLPLRVVLGAGPGLGSILGDVAV